jgi:hypothetical protein
MTTPPTTGLTRHQANIISDIPHLSSQPRYVYLADAVDPLLAELTQDADDRQTVIDNVVRVNREALERLGLSKAPDQGSLKHDEALNAVAIMERHIAQLEREKLLLAKGWEADRRGGVHLEAMALCSRTLADAKEGA